MNTRSDRGWVAVLVAAVLVIPAVAIVSSAQRNFKTVADFDGSNREAPRLGYGDVADSSGARFQDGNPNLLQTGQVTSLGPTACPSGAASGASCKSIRVSCTVLGNTLPDLDATLGVAFPSGSVNGTIILLNGGPGTTFLNSGFADDYVADGFQVVQLAWASDWASANGLGVKSAACRPATVFKYVFQTVQKASRTTGFCGQGISGGGAQLADSLAQYGLSDFFDYVVIAAGPGVSRMDYGCDPPLYTGPQRDLCPLLTNAPFTYSSQTASNVNGWEGTTTRGDPNPLPGDIDRWKADSVVTAGASFSYPNTGMSWFFCVNPSNLNESTGQGSFLIGDVDPKNNPPDVNCYNKVCQLEAVWENSAAFKATEQDILTQCVANH